MMADQSVADTISALSTRVQFGASVVIAAAALIVWNRPGDQRTHRLWVLAWVAFAISLAFVNLGLGALGLTPPGPGVATLLSALYTAFTVVFLVLIVAGAVAWRTAWRPGRRFVLGAVGSMVASAGVVGLLDPTNVQLFGAENGLGAACFFVAGVLMVQSPMGRRGMGTMTAGLVMLSIAVLWSLNSIAFLEARRGPLSAGGWADVLLTYNGFIDTALELSLGAAMLLILSEELMRFTFAAERREQETIAASEARLSSVIESARDGIVTLDGDRRVVHYNEATARIYRVDRTGLRGIPLDTLILSDEASNPEGPPPLAVARHEGRRPFTGFRPDGTTFPGVASVAPLIGDPDGGWVCIIRDETEAQQVAVEQEALRQQLAKAQRLETVGQMVSGVAHELNNPLAAILAFAEELHHSALEAADADAVQVIAQQAQRCRAIVRDLLRIARQRDLDREPVDLRPVLDSVLRAQRLAFDEAGVELTLSTESVPLVLGERAALEQVLANLVANARYVSPRGGRVRVRAEQTGAEVVIQIEDQGPGIPEVVQPRLFEPFFTTKPEGEGTGLGLAVSRGLIVQMGGTLSLENHPTGGALATVRLPAIPITALAHARSLTPAEPLALLTTTPRRVLLVDDEQPVRSAVRRYLERLQWTVEEAPDGAIALDLLLQADLHRYAVVICDIRMPVVSGVELYDRLRTERPELVTRMLFITGDVASVPVAEFLARSSVNVIEKPFDLPVLGQMVAEVAVGRRAAPMPQASLPH
jgi:PAS domain S-box-containing protein